MDLQALTGQLHIVNGSLQTPAESGGFVPGLLAQPAPPKAHRSRKKEFLFVHLMLSGPPEETAVPTQELLTLISQEFYRTGGSVTAALRQAITSANKQLLHRNLSGAAPTREGAITTAVLHNDALYVVQAGEGLALLGHNFGVERLPANQPQRITPLGRSAGLSMRYEHHPLQEGDMLLLADPRIANIPTPTLEPALVDTGVEDGLEALQTIIGPNSARLLLIEFTGSAPESFPDVLTPLPAAQLTPEDFPEPVREGDAPVIPATERRPQPERPSPPPKQNKDLAAEASYNTRKAAAGAAFGLANFTDWLTDMLARLRPPHREDEEPTNWAIPALLALLIPVIVAVIVTGVYLQRGNARRFAEIKTEMSQNISLAETAGAETPDEARQYYENVVTLSAEADELRPGDAEVASLRQKALAGLDDLDGVTRLQGEVLYTYTPEVVLKSVTLQDGFDGGLFTLDQASNVYYHQTDQSYMQLDDAPSRIIFAEQAVGSYIVRNVIDMMWRPEGTAVTRDGLAMLDSGGALLTYYPNKGDTRAAPLGLSSVWQTPAAITTFDERLYILDPGAREIWKYYPDGDGFTINEGEQILELDPSADLNAAIDLDIYSEDGSLLLLYGDGRLRYYDTRSGRVQWDEQELLENGGLTLPLANPTAAKLVGKGLNASIFVADPGTGRIIQIARGGRVIAQYRAYDETGQDLFRNIQDFAVAEGPLRIFVTDGSKLYVATQ
jgi:hypothetical protein